MPGIAWQNQRQSQSLRFAGIAGRDAA